MVQGKSACARLPQWSAALSPSCPLECVVPRCSVAIWAVKYAAYKVGCVACVLKGRGHCVPFRLSIPPLQVAPSSACSVASLSQSPGH